MFSFCILNLGAHISQFQIELVDRSNIRDRMSNSNTGTWTFNSYAKLTDAIDRVNQDNGNGKLIWAIDKNRTRRKDDREVSYVGKRFYLANRNEMYRMMQSYKYPNVYEIIRGGPCKLYIDIDYRLDEPREVFPSLLYSSMLKLLIGLIKHHLRYSFEHSLLGGEDFKELVYSACDKQKMSFHLIFPTVIFNDSRCSMLSYVHELKAYVEQTTMKANGATEGAQLLRKDCGIDTCVYRSNQQFRLPGNCKLGQAHRPLVQVTKVGNEYQIPFPLPNNDWTYSKIVTTAERFREGLITFIPESSDQRITVLPSERLSRSYAAPFISLDEIYGNEHPKDDMRSGARYFVEKIALSNLPANIDSLHKQVRKGMRNNLNLQDFQSKEVKILDDDENVLLEGNKTVLAATLTSGDVLFCTCEINENGPIGIPSAKAFLGKGGSMGIHCFNCRSLTWILDTAEQFGFTIDDEYKEQQLIRIPDNHQLNFGTSLDVDFDEAKSIYILDAPMGSGKTHVAHAYLNKNKQLSVLAITFRISLAKYMAQRLNLNCYLEKGIYDHDEKSSRMVICLDSIYKLGTKDYDILLLDEATFIRYHFVSGTINATATAVVNKFVNLIRNAGKVIVMQHRISDSTVDFYVHIRRCKESYPEIVKKKLDRPVLLHPLQLAVDVRELLAGLVSDYINNYVVEQQKSRMPIIVFCTRADYAEGVVYLLKVVAEKEFGEEAARRIKGVWSTVQDEEWNSKFLQDPNQYARDCDILVATSVIQAGHSFEHWFRKSYDILFLNVLTYREELQLVSRLRILGRKDLASHHVAWIQPGKVNSKIAGEAKLTSIIASYTDSNEVANFLAKTLAIVQSEKADSANRHQYLWRQEYRRSNVKFSNYSSTNNHTTYTPDFVKNTLLEFVKMKDIGIRKWLAYTLDDETGEQEVIQLLDSLDIQRMASLLNIENISQNIESYVQHSNKHAALAVVTHYIKNLQTTTNSILPYLGLAKFLDFFLFQHPPDLMDLSAKSFWERRVQLTKNKVAGASDYTMMEMLYKTFIAFGLSIPKAGETSIALHEEIWSSYSDEVFAKTLLPYAGAYALHFHREMHVILKACYQAKINGNGSGFTYRKLCRNILKIVGLKMKRNRTLSLQNLVQSLTMLKALLPDTHYSAYKNIFEPAIWQKAAKEFEDIASTGLSMISPLKKKKRNNSQSLRLPRKRRDIDRT
jgi:Origin of replication binding protein